MHTSRLLLVEDDDCVADAFVEILTREGYQVDRARNGAEGLTSLRTGSTPTLILLDWIMPVLNGPEMVRSMQQELSWSRIPIVLITASDEAKDQTLALRASGYLKKPVDPADLVRMVNAIVREPTTPRSNRLGVGGDHPTLDRMARLA